MAHMHTCYMEDGSIINGFTGGIIEEPALLVSKSEDILHAWGNKAVVEKKFEQRVLAYTQLDYKEELENLMLIELSNYKIDREMACYILRRATEFTATRFIEKLCRELQSGDPVEWIRSEMNRISIDINEKEWK